MLQQYEQQYKQCPLFYGVKEEDLSAMLECLGAYVKKYPKAQYMILREESVRCVGVVMEGTVQMLKEDMWGNKSILTTIGKGELFGETFACGALAQSTVSFVASTTAVVLFLPFEKIMHSCSMACVFHHRLIENMVTLIANKNVRLMEKLEVISKKTLREKIYAYLSSQSKQLTGEYFTLPLGRIELAEYLGANRSALTRELNAMREDGYIDFEKNTFRILKQLL